MRLRFDAYSGDHDDAFRDARDALLDEFDRWRDGRGDRDDGTAVANATMFLDWRYTYSSGVLDEYRDDDIAEFLLEWCPRKYSAPADAALDVCRSVGQLIEFLARTDRLVGGADRAARLITLTQDLAPESFRAMGDPSRFGMAKSLFAGALGDLPDVENADELQALLEQKMAEFNALPVDQRTAITDRFVFPPESEPEPVELPFVHVPPPHADVAAAAASAPIIAKLDALRGYLGDDGKALTDKGNLKLADGRSLVELLETGDQFDPSYGERTFKTRSTSDLRQLRLIIELAKAIGAVRVHKHRLVPVRAWAKRSAIDRAVAALHAVVDEGPLWMLFQGGYFGHDPIAEAVDGGLVHWLVMLLPPRAEVPYDDIVTTAQSAVHAEVGLRSPYWTEEEIGRSVARDMSPTVKLMQLINVVDWRDRVETTTELGTVESHGGTLTLTALGRHAVPELAAAAGYEFRSTGDLAEAGADELLAALADVDIDDLEAVVTSWQPALEAPERAQRVARAVAETASAGDRIAGIAVFDLLGVEDSEPYVRQLLDSNAAGHAATWLLAHGLADQETVGRFVGIGMLIDVLASCLDDPHAVCGVFLESPTVADAENALQQMWRHDAPETVAVLDTLGRHLTDRRLAKAARKALIQHRSWMANQH